jgi:glycosyltransferase involved in cell wall biosynthesis
MKQSKPSVLYVAYPLLAVSEESAGGAEQVLLTLEREMHAAGHRTTVAAADGSRAAGELLATGAPASEPDQYEAREREHSTRILDFLDSHPGEFDLIHDMSGSFFRRAAECGAPVLATLHLPRWFYKQELFPTTAQVSGQTEAANLGHQGLANASTSSGQALGHQASVHSKINSIFNSPAPNLRFSCVSHSQAQTFADLRNLAGLVQNGVAVEQFPFTRDKDGYVLWLGRICEEKAPHLAIAVAQRAGVPLVIAGQVYPFRYHLDYFECEVRPHLNGRSRVQFVDTPLASQKLNLLRHARALLLTSTTEETSSLVAMEAMACGTPVVAFRRGAFPEIVAHEETGFIVDTPEEMAAALRSIDRISPEKCRARVERHFRASRMAQEYEELYRRMSASAKELAA